MTIVYTCFPLKVVSVPRAIPLEPPRHDNASDGFILSVAALRLVTAASAAVADVVKAGGGIYDTRTGGIQPLGALLRDVDLDTALAMGKAKEAATRYPGIVRFIDGSAAYTVRVY